ncbi:MAG TPA: DUF411 domain-containing protein [Limnobacter sp.]|nr:DUF411 domain-containing protein [Limnobacter sp.]
MNLQMFIHSGLTASVACLLLLTACGKGNSSGDVAVAQAQAVQTVEVWKTPTCGCCSEWVDHLRQNGFEVKVNDVQDTAAFRAALGMPQDYGSCHSAKVAGYAIEGHVPAEDIKKLLADRPDAVGLAVPGMPLGSPGMEHPDMPHKRHAYDVLLVSKQGEASAYTHYEAK